MGWRAGVVVAALVAGLVGAPAPATAAVAADPCGDVVSAAQDRDLSGVRFEYSASSFQVRATLCAPTSQTSPNGDWQLIVHLPGIAPDFQLIGLMTDLGRYAEWSGFYACDKDPCPLQSNSVCDSSDVNGGDCGITPGSTRPAGVRLENDDYWRSADLPTLSGRTAFGYGSWSSVLPPGSGVPNDLAWWAEVRQASADGSRQVDRLPDSGTASSARNTAPAGTAVQVAPGAPPVWESSFRGPLRTDTGTLRTADGAGVRGRYVSVRPAEGRTPSDAGGAWSTSYRVRANTTVTALFPGDGVHEPSRSAPFHAYVRAFVSLDVPAQLRLGTPVELRGVVRPHGTRGVEVLVKPDAPGYAWSLLRTAPLVAGRTDTYYRASWTPRTRGRYVLVTGWRYGSTAEGAVLNGQSAYRRVTVG